MNSRVGTKGLLLQVWCIFLVFVQKRSKHICLLKGHVIINIRSRKFPSSSGVVRVWCISCYRKQEYMVEKAHFDALFYV